MFSQTTKNKNWSLAMIAMTTTTESLARNPMLVQDMPGEQLLLLRVVMGRKAARVVSAELDRRATLAILPEAAVAHAAVVAKPSRRRQAA